MILVSVIIPLYNGEKYIKETLLALTKSQLSEIEFIVVDDGSSDESVEICREIQKRDQRIKLFQKKNEGGVYATRNYGMKKANGKYICFCDQDDIVEPNMYKIMYYKAEQEMADIVICSTGKVVSGCREVYESFSDKIYYGRESINELILKNIFVNTHIYEGKDTYIGNSIWKCMINRDFILDNNIAFKRYVNYEDDWLFMLDILARANKVVTISNKLYYWRINLESETYTTRYVENMYEKSVMVQNDVEKKLEVAEVEATYIKKFIAHYNCTRYVEIIENELRNKNSDMNSKIQNISKIYDEEDVVASISISKMYCANLARKKIAVGMLKYRWVFGAYCFLKYYNKIKRLCLKSKYWTRLENKLKNRG